MSRKLALSILVLILAAIVLLAILFAFPLRHAFVSAVVTPLIRDALILRWYLHRISQSVLWIALVLAGSLLMLRVLLQTFPRPETSKKNRYRIVKTQEESDLKELTETISRARRHPFARRRVASRLVSLSVRLIAQRERLSLKEARERFEAFSWCDDDAVSAFFNFRWQYYGVGLGKAFDRRLHKTVEFLERYHQGV